MVDVAVVLVLALAGLSGWREGLITSALGAVGWIAGLLIGLRYAPDLLMGLSLPPGADVVVHLVAFLICAAVGAALLHLVASVVVRVTSARPLRALDSLAGAVAAVVVAAFVVWLLAGAVRPGLPATASRSLAEARTLQMLDDVIPGPARALLTKARGAVDRHGFPDVFDGLTPEPIRPAQPPDTRAATTVEVQQASRSVMRVLASSSTCNAAGQGSGWVVADQRVVTNAHVVTGATSVSVQVTGQGRRLPATVVAFDPRLDLAVLRVPGLQAPALPRASSLSPGSNAVVAGFPRNGGYTVKAARLRSTQTALGRDIYGSAPVQRQIHSLRTTVQPGNSGGPLLTTTGRVAGTVFARSMDDAGTGYALTDRATDRLLDRAAGLRDPVATGACAVR